MTNLTKLISGAKMAGVTTNPGFAALPHLKVFGCVPHKDHLNDPIAICDVANLTHLTINGIIMVQPFSLKTPLLVTSP